MSKLFTAIVLTTVLTSCGASTERDLREQFRWLAGKWQGQHMGNQVIEVWYWDKHRYRGQGFEVNGSDTTFGERIYLESFDGDVAYIACVMGQSPILFSLQKADSGVFHFQNLEHDFPAHITYTQMGDTAIEVALSAANSEAPYSYILRRVK